MKMENKREAGKGLVAQIQERSKIVISGEIDWDEFVETIKKLEEESRRQSIKQQKQIKENLKHIAKRSEELGEDPPAYLMMVITNPCAIVGSDFMKKYAKWL